jgi:carbamate kinase
MILARKGFVVVAVGGGGIPVIGKKGELKGIEAVIDKDYASSLLATEIKADLFLITTSGEKVALNFGKPDQKPLDKMTLKEAEKIQRRPLSTRQHGPENPSHHTLPRERRKTSHHHEHRKHRTRIT